MTQCQSCTAPTDLFLCTHCTADLTDRLHSLVTGGTIIDIVQEGRTASGKPWRIERERRHPGLLEHLTEAALGQTRMGDGGRRIRREPDHLKGDTSLEPYTHLDDNQRAALRRQFLAAGGINARASDQLTKIRKLLTEWADKLATSTGTTWKPLDPSDTAAIALWLAANTHQLANIDDIGALHHQITNTIKKIERIINRPEPPRFCGVCTTIVDGKECNLALYARREAIEVTCPNPKCRTTHNIDRLWNKTLNAADYKRFKREELIGNQRTNSPERYTTGIMGELSEFVHWRTFKRWIDEKRLRPAGYVRPDGRRGINRRSDEDIPEYRLADVRKVRRLMNQDREKAG